MLAVGILLCYLLGIAVMQLISRKYSLAEWIGFSFLIGMGLETVFLFLFDIVGIKYSQGALIGVNLVAILGLLAANYKNLLAFKDEFKAPAFSYKDINLAALAILCFAAYLFYAITVKNLFWPPADHDAIGSFDKLGKIMALEGKLKISLFQYNLEGAGGIYPPLFHGSFAYVYIFGAIIPKIATTLFFLSLLTSFYGLLRRYVDSTAASLFTLLLMITPELFSHAALSLGNLPTTAYVGPAALATILWLDKRDQKYFWIGAILMAFVIWVRSDTVVFTAAALLIVGVDFLRNKNWKQLLAYGTFAVAPFLIWTLYVKVKLASTQGARLNTAIGINGERLSLMGNYVKAFLFGGQYQATLPNGIHSQGIDGGQLFGIVFILFVIILLVNLAFIFKTGIKEYFNKNFSVLAFTLGSFFLYFLVFYLIDEKAQNSPMYSLMESSFKRGLFCFVPLALFYCAASPASSWLFERIEKFRTGS